jgi:hypothetical protein
MFYSSLCYPYPWTCVLQQTACASPGRVYSTAAHGRVCFTSICAVPGPACYIAISAVPEFVCSTADSAAHRRVFCKAICAAPGRVCSTADCAAPGRVCYISICAAPEFVCSTADSAAHGRVCCKAICAAPGPSIRQQPAYAVLRAVRHTAACAAPEHVCLQEPVVHLYMPIYKNFMLHLEMSVYNVLSGRP